MPIYVNYYSPTLHSNLNSNVDLSKGMCHAISVKMNVAIGYAAAQGRSTTTTLGQAVRWSAANPSVITTLMPLEQQSVTGT